MGCRDWAVDTRVGSVQRRSNDSSTIQFAVDQIAEVGRGPSTHHVHLVSVVILIYFQLGKLRGNSGGQPAAVLPGLSIGTLSGFRSILRMVGPFTAVPDLGYQRSAPCLQVDSEIPIRKNL